MYEKCKKIAAVGAAAVMLTPCTLPARAESEKPISVMCLGDSITDGFWLTGGYRNTLCTMLTEQGLASEFDFVGPNWGIATSDNYDPNHAGYSGYSIADIAQADSISGGRTGITGFAEKLLRDYPADVVLLQIGTNDILSLYDLEHFGERLAVLADIILAALPADGQLYLATLPVMDATNNLYISDYYFTVASMDAAVSSCNGQIRTLANSLREAGKPVTLAEINGVLTKADLYDGVHPSEAGYAKMGRFWCERLCEYRAFRNMNGETDTAETEATAPETAETTSGTTAAETVVQPAAVPGDLNADCLADVKDAVLAVRIIGQDADYPASGIAPADFNSNGVLDTDDLTTLLKFIAGIVTEYDLRKTS